MPVTALFSLLKAGYEEVVVFPADLVVLAELWPFAGFMEIFSINAGEC
jgi:hypothetical protein